MRKRVDMLIKNNKIVKYCLGKIAYEKINSLYSNKKIDSAILYRICLSNVRVVSSPLVLISQIQRSGGTMLSQLFDGHPDILAHPYELKIGKPKYKWPRINLDDSPVSWFKILRETDVLWMFREGYKKSTVVNEERFPFLFLPSLQQDIFVNYFAKRKMINLRDVYDGYMTSYFNAWLGYQHQEKQIDQRKYITGFVPKLAMCEDSIEMFFNIYKEGYLISIVRDPRNWFASAFKHMNKNKYSNIEHATDLWIENIESMIRNKNKYGDRVCLISFEDLICNTERVMRMLSKRIGVEYSNNMLTPTFNMQPIKADTSFKETDYGIISDVLERYKTLKKEDIDYIDGRTKLLYERIINITMD